jgi:hypothetical protein
MRINKIMRSKRFKRLWSVLAVFCVLLCITNCSSSGDTTAANDSSILAPVNEPVVEAPVFNEDSAYFWLEKQLSFGPRVPGTIGHQKCGDWIIEQLKKWGAEVTVQNAQVKNHEGQILNIRNIIASYNPRIAKRIILSAHWDTRPHADADSIRTKEPFPGANDGASGVAALLEFARIFHQTPPPVGIELCFWDAEDGGKVGDNESWCLGSQYWAKNKHKPDYVAEYGINLDMVGAKGATFLQEVVSLRYAPKVVEKVWNTAHQIGYGGFFPIYKHPGEIIDDHYYINTIAGIPFIDIIHLTMNSGSFFPHWHTHGDNLDAIDKRTLKAVGQTVLAVVYQEKPPIA